MSDSSTNTATRYERAFFLPAAADRVFAACTDADQLRVWFAEHIDLTKLEPGAPMRFWGKATLGTTTESAASQRITAFEPGERIEFEWNWAGVPSAVEWRFGPGQPPSYGCSPDDDPPKEGTSMTVRHTLEAPLPYPRPDQVVDDFWRLATGNLMGHLEGRGNVVLPDFEDPEPIVRLSIEIAAPPAAVFRALTIPEILDRWLSKTARVELREGGAFDLGWGPVAEHVQPMRILELEPDRKLSFSWPDWRQQADVPDQTVMFELSPIEDGTRTRVDFTHSGFERAVDRSDYQQGWTYFLDGLVREAPKASA